MDSASSWSWVTRMAVVPARGEDLLHVGPDAGPQVRVERRERLVQQHELGLDGQRPGQRDALLLAAGQLMRVALAQPGQARPTSSSSPMRGPRRWPAGSPKPTLAATRQVREQAAFLRHVADPAPLGRHVRARAVDH